MSARTCDPISTVTTEGTFAYAVRIETGTVGCGKARAVLKFAADETAGPSGWSCRPGTGSEPWGISCARGNNLIRAYGPTLTDAAPAPTAPDPWVAEAEAVGYFLLRPSYTAGLKLTGIELRPPCTGSKHWIVASYGTPGGTTLDIAEGAPAPCGNLGAPPRVATWWIHGRPVWLVEDCAPTGCARLSGDYALEWRRGELGITVFAHHFGQHQLLAVVRSLRRVP